MIVSVIGLGYIGLPTAAVIASRDIKVFGYDVNANVVNKINSGHCHIIEPGLDELVNAKVGNNYLKADTNINISDVYIIAVPTPFIKETAEIPKPDLSYIENATRKLAGVLKKGDLIILESTSPVGTTKKMESWLMEDRADLKFPSNNEKSDVNIAYCPERVLPGKVINELQNNDRVIGGLSHNCSERAAAFYKKITKGNCYVTDSKTAEMTKLTENASRDVQIAFANELSIICEDMNIDVWELIELTNKHPRVNILNPGPGVGGHCIAVDPWFIVHNSPTKSKIIKKAREINDLKPKWVIEKVLKLALELKENKHKEHITVSCYGLTFKPNIDDIRESPALSIVKELNNLDSFEVIAVEPNIKNIDDEDIRLVTLNKAITKGDIHLILVNHDDFKTSSFIKLENIIDTVGLLN